MLVVVASYRQNVHAYPSGGGDYEVATVNLGRRAGSDRRERADGRLRADGRRVGQLRRRQHHVGRAVAAGARGSAVCRSSCVVIMVLNLRGIRESGTAFAHPDVRLHRSASACSSSSGFTKLVTGHHLTARERRAARTSTLLNYSRLCAGVLAASFVRLGVYGADRRRGDQQRRPVVQEAEEQERCRRRSALLGGIAVTMFLAITALAIISHVHVAPDSSNLISGLPPGVTSEDRHRPGRHHGVRRRPVARVLLPADHDRVDPRARGQHRLQRLPGAGVDSGSRRLPAPPAAHPR